MPLEVLRCCPSVKLPGGERKWRRMARIAGFDRKLLVRGFRKADRHDVNRISLGTMDANGKRIVVRINHACGWAKLSRPSAYNPLATFGHELGHFILKQRGNREWATQRVFRSDTEQGADPVERACDRYSRLLRNRS